MRAEQGQHGFSIIGAVAAATAGKGLPGKAAVRGGWVAATAAPAGKLGVAFERFTGLGGVSVVHTAVQADFAFCQHVDVHVLLLCGQASTCIGALSIHIALQDRSLAVVTPTDCNVV